MCGRYFLEAGFGELEDIVGQAVAASWGHAGRQQGFSGQPVNCGFNCGEVCPGTVAPVVTLSGAAFMKWGLKASPGRRPHINARSETARSLPTFRDAIRRRRCLVPATSYFEWMPVGCRQKIKYEFFAPGACAFYMAGIYTESCEFAIVTRGASKTLARFHDRMPVAWLRAEAQAWLELNSGGDVAGGSHDEGIGCGNGFDGAYGSACASALTDFGFREAVGACSREGSGQMSFLP